jgi:hypothetical protein
VSRVAQLAGIALSAGVASYASGLIIAAILMTAGALGIALMLPPTTGGKQ